MQGEPPPAAAYAGGGGGGGGGSGLARLEALVLHVLEPHHDGLRAMDGVKEVQTPSGAMAHRTQGHRVTM